MLPRIDFKIHFLSVRESVIVVTDKTHNCILDKEHITVPFNILASPDRLAFLNVRVKAFVDEVYGEEVKNAT